MTQPQQYAQPGQPAPPSQPPPPLLVTPEPGSPLDDLLSQREAAIARVEEAEAYLEAVKDRIKVILTGAYPGVPVIDIAPGTHRPALRLAWRTPRGLDTDRMKREASAVYNSFLVWKKPYWELRKRS